MDVTFLLDHEAPEPGKELEVRGLLRIEGAAPPETGDRLPLNVALVLDRSGSMGGSKLAYAREAAALLVRRLGPQDRVSVVVYDHEVQTLAEAATGDSRAALLHQLGSLAPRGSTNLSGGWLQGRELVSRAVDSESVNRIILMTDGLANVGITDPAQLVKLCRTAASSGITTTTIGFGADFDEDLLRAMADAGGGAAHYIENPDQAPAVFEEEITGLLGLAAQNVSVVVRPGETVRLARVRHSYPSEALADGALRLQIGDLYGSEPRLLLTEFLVPPMAELRPDLPVAGVTIEGDVLGHDGSVERRVIELAVTLDATTGARAVPEVRKTRLLLDAAEARDDALDRQAMGDWHGATECLRVAARELESVADGDPTIVAEMDDLRAVAHQLQDQEFSAMDVKYMKQQAHRSRRARYHSKVRLRRGEQGGESKGPM